MQPNLEDVREWMAEGDRLMAEAYDYLNIGTGDPMQLDLAGRHFSRAAQAYLAGGATIGPYFTFAYLASEHAARQPRG